jgi:hypothetical protein
MTPHRPKGSGESWKKTPGFHREPQTIIIQRVAAIDDIRRSTVFDATPGSLGALIRYSTDGSETYTTVRDLFGHKAESSTTSSIGYADHDAASHEFVLKAFEKLDSEGV